MRTYIKHIKLTLLTLFILLLSTISYADNVKDVKNVPGWAKHYFQDKTSGPMDFESPNQKKSRLTKKADKVFKNKGFYEDIPLIIKLDSQFIPEGFLSSTLKNKQRQNIKAVQKLFKKKLKNKSSYYANKEIVEFDTISYVALRLNKNEIEDILDIAEVADIQVDELSAPSMAESNIIIGSDSAWADGNTGSGQTVAVLDTGVDKTHPFLAGKVVSEACYSDAGGFGSGTSLCPGGVSSSTAAGSGVNCSAAVDGCDHGTHVAGTIAGKNATISGVAPDSRIIAINVFTNIGGEALSYTSDQIKGLERVFALKDTYEIASVNMSLGGGRYYNYCDGDSRKAIIDNLRSAGIATVIASGNSGYTDSIGAPACISTAVTVGATEDGSYGTTADRVASFSNSSSLIDLLAPGKYITSSVPGGGYSAWMGTSMATPHVAGAFALVKGYANTATVDEIESALKATGTSVTDSRNSVAKPRINVDDAITSFGTGEITVTINPAGATSDGAQWAIDGGSWNDSGDTVSGVSLGAHTIAFKSTTHSNNSKVWVSPLKDTVTISSDGDTINNTYAYTEADKTNTVNDANGDGKSDIFWRNNADSSVAVWLMDGSVLAQGSLVTDYAGTTKYPGNTWQIRGMADANGDGKSDIFWRNESTGAVAIWMMDGPTVVSSVQIKDDAGNVKYPGLSWRIRGMSDANGDGKSDIFWRNESTGAVAVWIMNGDKLGSSLEVKDGAGNIKYPGLSWKIRGMADADGDGKSDIFWRNESTGAVAVWIMNDAVLSSSLEVKDGAGNVKYPGLSWKIRGMADADADGKSDIFWRNESTGAVAVWLMNDAVLSSSLEVKDDAGNVKYPGLSWKIRFMADADADGKSDIFWRNESNGAVAVWLMNDAVLSSSVEVKDDLGNLKTPSLTWKISPE